MSTTEVTMYRIICDYPGCGLSAQEGGDYYAWSDAGQATDDANNADWLVLDGDKHYCREHTVYDEDKDEYVPMLDPQGATS